MAPGVRVCVQLLIAGGTQVYAALFLGRWGQTLGMMAVGVRAVDLHSGGTLPRAKAWVRQAALFAMVGVWSSIAFAVNAFNHHTTSPPGTLFLVVGIIMGAVTYLWPLGNTANQTLQDKAAGQ